MGIVNLVGAIVLGLWLAWCATFQFLSVSTEAEIVGTSQEQRTGRWGRKFTLTYGEVRYFDQEGKAHTDKVQLFGRPEDGRRIPVRYLPSSPDDCRSDTFWGIWGLSVFMTGFFVVTANLPSLRKRWRVRRATRRKPPAQSAP